MSEEPKKFPTRNSLLLVFALITLLGFRYKFSGTASYGGVTEMYDNYMIAIGILGMIAAYFGPWRPRS